MMVIHCNLIGLSSSILKKWNQRGFVLMRGSRIDKMRIYWIIALVFVVLLAGCSNSDTNANDIPVSSDETTGNDKLPEILGLTNEITRVTSSQLRQITSKMTYNDVINVLGNTKDIGSGIWILQYEYETGDMLQLNIINGPESIIDEGDYQEIQDMLSQGK